MAVVRADPLWGIENWPRIYEIAGVLLEIAFLTYFIRRSRRLGRIQPALVLVLALTALAVWDPLASPPRSNRWST